MSVFARLGLQKRIMLYVTLGLVVMFAAFSWLGLQALDRSTDAAFAQRLVIAQSVAAFMSGELNHAALDAKAAMSRLSPESGDAETEAAVAETLHHMTGVYSYAFFTVTSVSLVDSSGLVLAVAPEGHTPSGRLEPASTGARPPGSSQDTRILWSDDGRPGQFVTVSVPLAASGGEVWARVLVDTAAESSSEPFVLLNFLDPALDDSAQGQELEEQAEYHLEVLTPTGITVLGIGPEEYPGGESEHYSIIKPLMDAGGSDAMLHDVPAGSRDSDHVMAVVPVPGSELYLVLEQDTDVALALPNRFRRQLILFGSLGFLATLLVAWLTTRHVVKPTEELTAAAVRMAGGELDAAIPATGQGEIGVLAENLEAMRQQLNDALEEVATTNRELESRVRERTRQLQELVRRVLTAHEEERSRVALELHDETAQVISALSGRLDYVVSRSDSLSPEDSETLRESRQLATGLLTGIRRLINALRPVALEEMGLATALRRYAEELLDAAGADVRVGIDGPRSKVPEHVELALYRIGQEALNNVARHAGAQNVWIDIAYSDSSVSLTVRDDGAGFDPAEAARSGSAQGGLGLAGMQERVALVDGSVTIDSALGRGTTVRAEVPVDADV